MFPEKIGSHNQTSKFELTRNNWFREPFNSIRKHSLFRGNNYKKINQNKNKNKIIYMNKYLYKNVTIDAI